MSKHSNITFVHAKVYIYAKLKSLGAVKKGAAKQGRINAITEFDW